MANRRFETAVTALWTRLGMAAPTFRAEDNVTLMVEGVTITLAEGRDGERIMISGSPGRLAADPSVRGQQVARLLKSNLGFLLTSRAGLRLDDSGTVPAMRVEADWRYAEGSAESLVQRVEDVLQQIEFHRPDLAEQTHARPAAVPAGADDFRSEFIIRL